MASWLARNRIRPFLPVVERTEGGREASRSHRTRPAQFARIGFAKFADHHRHLGGRGFAGCDAFSWDRSAATRVAAADEVWIIRYRSGHLSARFAQLQSRRRA